MYWTSNEPGSKNLRAHGAPSLAAYCCRGGFLDGEMT